jgi:hypothetical protein
VHIKIDAGVQQDGDEPDGSAEDESEFVASLFFANVQLRYADGGPGFRNAKSKQTKRRGDESRADDAPICEGVQNVVVGAVWLQLKAFGPKIAKTAIEVCGTSTPPEIFAPDANGGTPKIEAGVIIDLPALLVDQLPGTLMEELAFRN